MSKFWQKKYISKYTGKEIDDAIGQVIEGGGGGELPDITVADYEKMLTVNDQGKFIVKKVKYDILLTSTDGTTWDADISFSTLQEIIATSPRLPLRFNFELKYISGDTEIEIGYVYNAVGVLVSKSGSDPFVQFTLDGTKYIVIDTNGVTVYFE